MCLADEAGGSQSHNLVVAATVCLRVEKNTLARFHENLEAPISTRDPVDDFFFQITTIIRIAGIIRVAEIFVVVGGCAHRKQGTSVHIYGRWTGLVIPRLTGWGRNTSTRMVRYQLYPTNLSQTPPINRCETSWIVWVHVDGWVQECPPHRCKG